MSTEEANMIARIDERTQLILEILEKKASEESVAAVAKRLDVHESSHVTKSGLIAAWGGTAVALLIAFIGFLRGSSN